MSAGTGTPGVRGTAETGAGNAEAMLVAGNGTSGRAGRYW